jgi:DNA-binding cell septation regulator SpoVG
MMTISRMNKGNWGKIKAFFDLETSEGFTLKGFKLIEGINGLFVGFPSEKKEDEYIDTVWAGKELKQQVEELALREYGNPNFKTEENDKDQTGEEDAIPF